MEFSINAYAIFFIGPVKQKCRRKIAIIFLSISLNMCFGDGYFEYLQHMFWLRKKKIIYSHALLFGFNDHAKYSLSIKSIFIYDWSATNILIFFKCNK